MKANVDVTEPLGSEVYLYMLAGDESCIARVDPRTSAAIGNAFDLVIDMSNMQLFDRSTQEVIR